MLRNQRGFTMLEALLVVIIFSIIGLALAGMFQSSRTGIDSTLAMSFLQRAGTAVSEQMQRELTAAVALQIVDCGPQTTNGKAVMYMTPMGNTRCIYEWTYGGDPGPQLYRCTLAAWSVSGGCTNTPENLLLIQQLRNAPENVAINLRAQNIFFQRVTCLPNSGGSCGDPGRQVVSPLFDFRFDLDIVGFIDQRTMGFTGQRFAGSFTTRN